MNGAGIVCENTDSRWELVGVAGGRQGGCVNGGNPRSYEETTEETVKWSRKTIQAFERGV